MMNKHAVRPTILVIGYGEQSVDEMTGPWLGNLIEEMNFPDVQVHNVSQLTPELAGKIARVDYVIFVTTCKMRCSENVRVTPLEPVGSETSGSSTPALGHSCDPRSLLALTQSVHGHHPQAWFVEVPPIPQTPAVGLEVF
jgi:Ni,Fe-hydrogenase maturation factor